MLNVDGIIFTLQRAGGISAIFRSLLGYLNRENIVTNHLLDGICQQELPQFSWAVRTQVRKSRSFERYRSCRSGISESKPAFSISSIFHSSYYRIPADLRATSVLTVYDFMYERFRKGPPLWVHSIQKEIAIKRAQSIICISQATLDDLVKYVGLRSDQKVHVVHCGVSDLFKPIAEGDRESNFEDPPYMLFVGQRGGYKNFKLALSTLAVLPDFELKCVGGGEFKKTEFEGIPGHVLSRVKHMGFIRDEELNILYTRAACLFYPSSHEGFGIPVIEAMKAGCPVVSINCKAILEIGGGALLMVPEQDPIALAGEVLRSVSSERLHIVNRGIINADKYSWEIANKKTVEIYKEVGLRC